MLFVDTKNDLANARIFIEYNGFTNDDVRLIISKEQDLVAVVAKRANLTIRDGFVPFLNSAESVAENDKDSLDTRPPF
jgi:hypothetical protein